MNMHTSLEPTVARTEVYLLFLALEDAREKGDLAVLPGWGIDVPDRCTTPRGE